MCPQDRPTKTRGELAQERALTDIQKRFIESGLEDFTEREIIRLILSLGQVCDGCLERTEACLKNYESLRKFLSAPIEELQEKCGLCLTHSLVIKFVREVPQRYLKEKIVHQHALKSSREVFDYLYYAMRDRKDEVFKVIYLNRHNGVKAIVDLYKGTLETILIAPREIVENAVKHGAAAMIFVHNHPSGDPTPSERDKGLTKDLVFIGNLIKIKVLDHIIIGDNQHFSFADEGLIEKYEDDFLNLKIRGSVCRLN